MYKYLAIMTGALAMLAGSLLVSDRAEAGASASAPSKYGRTSQVAAHQVRPTRQAQRSGFAITEFSSSSARPASHGHGYR
jgi:hypothetical protein